MKKKEKKILLSLKTLVQTHLEKNICLFFKLDFLFLCHVIFNSWKFKFITPGWTSIASKAWLKPTEVNTTIYWYQWATNLSLSS